MAVQEAGGEKEMQKHDGKQRRRRDWPQVSRLGEAPPEGDMEAGDWETHALYLEGRCVPTVKPLETMPGGLTSGDACS